MTAVPDAHWLAASARLGTRGRPLSRPNPAVGALVVKHGRVVGRGFTQPGGRPHAEAIALSAAGDAATGATLYVSLEPCAHKSERGPACADLAAGSGLARVVIGLRDPDPRTAGKGISALEQAGVAVEVIECREVRESLAGYLVQRNAGRPHVTLKLAMSLDGCIATADGKSQWITGEAARAHVHSRRAMSDAILVGGGTWRADTPRLDVRLPGIEDRSPQRIVLTRGDAPAGTVAIDAPGRISELEGIQYLYVEGGAQTAAAFIAEDLVDRLEIYRAPILIGGSGMPALGDFGLSSLAEAHDRWHLAERRQFGPDTYEAFTRIRED